MTNPTTIDRRDVAHSTNPVGGQDHIEEIEKPNRADKIDPDAARVPAGGGAGTVTGVSPSARDDLPDIGLPDDGPPVRSGMGGEDRLAPETDKANPGRLDQSRVEGRQTARMKSPRTND
jgi:hypothetical protein